MCECERTSISLYVYRHVWPPGDFPSRGIFWPFARALLLLFLFFFYCISPTLFHTARDMTNSVRRTPIKLCRQMDILILCILNIFSTVFSLTLSFFLNGTWSYDSKKWISINIVIYYCLNSALIDAKTRKHHIQTVQEKLVCSDQQQHDKVIAENQVMRICRSHTNNQCNHRQPWQLASNWLLRRCNKCWSKFPHRQCTQYMCIIASNQMEQQKTREKKNTWKAHA